MITCVLFLLPACALFASVNKEVKLDPRYIVSFRDHLCCYWPVSLSLSVCRSVCLSVHLCLCPSLSLSVSVVVSLTLGLLSFLSATVSCYVITCFFFSFIYLPVFYLQVRTRRGSWSSVITCVYCCFVYRWEQGGGGRPSLHRLVL